MSELGECRECVTRKKDHSKKDLHQCSYCGISFCVEHFEPKPVYIRDFSLYSKYPEVWVKIEEEIKVEGKHPCFQFTDHWFEEKDQELKLQKKLLMEWLDKSKAYRRKFPRIPMKEAPMKKLKLGDCPLCHSSNSKTLDYNAKTMTFQCNRCGHEWAQKKAFPYEIIEKVEISEFPKAETGHETKKKRKKILKVGIPVLIGLFLLIIGCAILPKILAPSLTPSPTPAPTPKLSRTIAARVIMLDFEAAVKFNSIEETKDYRFKMSMGKDYRIQEYWVYQYLGDGKIRIKDFSDPDFVRESGFIVQAGYSFAIGGSPAKGRHYLVMPIEVGSKDLVLRIEEIYEG